MEVLIDLRKELRQYRGAIVRIAKELNVSTNWVMRVLNGQESSAKVVEKSLEVLEQMKREKAEKEAANQYLFQMVSEAIYQH
jgi:hypothetical protein